MRDWKRICAALLCAALFMQPTAVTVAAAQTEDVQAESAVTAEAAEDTQTESAVTAEAAEDAAEEGETESSSVTGAVVGAAALTDTSYTLTERPALEELLAMFPETLSLYLEGQEEPVDVPVTWCSEVDYESTTQYYYMFEPQWDEDAYPRSDSLEEDSLPVLDVFLAEMESGSADGIMTVASTGNESTIYTYLTETLGLNVAAACGVLANMYAESGLSPTAVNSSSGAYGLCQWLSSRLTNLKSLYSSSYKTVSGQLAFTAQELGGLNANAVKASSYLRSVLNTSDGASNAAYYFAKYFEGCGSKYYAARQRLATNTYWAKYGGSSSTTVTISDYTLPTTMTTGSYFTVDGTLSSSKTITKVTAGCYTKSGTAVSGCYETVTPKATSYDLYNLDDDLLFSQLSPGIYQYKVTATTSAGTETVICHTFTVLAKASTVSGGTYYLYSTENSANVVAVSGSSASSGANIQLAAAADSSAYRFKVTYVSSGYYKIINASSGKALAVTGGTAITGTNVRQETYTGDDNQLWQILTTSSGSYCLVPKCATQCCLASVSSSSGSNIQISTESLANAQCWILSASLLTTSTTLSTPSLTSISGASSGVTVKWSAVTGAAKYRVFRKTSGSSWKKVGDTTSTSYTDTTAVAGTAYIYTVRCINSAGTAYTSGYDSTGLSITYTAAPSLTSISGASSGVTVKWSAVTGAAKYRVFRKTSGSSWKKVGDTTSTSYTDTTAVAGTAYIYTVRCINSKATAYTGGYDSTGLSITHTAAPSLNSISGASSGVTVKWSAVTGAAKYRVFRKTSGSSWKKVGDTTSTSYTDTTAVAGTAYIYTVRCINSAGTAYTGGYNSTGLSITYTAAPSLTSISGASSGVTVKWSAVTGAAKYRVFRKTSGSSWKKVGDTTSTSYTDTTAVAGTAYIYTVRCINSKATAYTGGYNSTGLSITYTAAPSLTGISATSGKVTVKWSAVTGAAKYRVFRKTSGSSWKKVGDTTSTSYTDTTAVAGTAYIYTVRCINSKATAYTGGYSSTGITVTAK